MTVWCWVRSTSTGHHFDLPLGPRFERLIAIGAVVEIPGRRRQARAARPPKRLVQLGERVNRLGRTTPRSER